MASKHLDNEKLHEMPFDNDDDEINQASIQIGDEAVSVTLEHALIKDMENMGMAERKTLAF